jgi:threonine aldolase
MGAGPSRKNNFVKHFKIIKKREEIELTNKRVLSKASMGYFCEKWVKKSRDHSIIFAEFLEQGKMGFLCKVGNKGFL